MTETPDRSPLEFPCTVCSAAIGDPCLDKTRGYAVREEPHWGRRKLAGEMP